MVTATNVGAVAVPTPWSLTITNVYYAGVSQAFGLSEPQFVLGGTLTGTAGDYWDVLWPKATNNVSVGFIVLSRSPDALQPDKVRHLNACLWRCKLLCQRRLVLTFLKASCIT